MANKISRHLIYKPGASPSSIQEIIGSLQKIIEWVNGGHNLDQIEATGVYL
jgi:hypothetical protein